MRRLVVALCILGFAVTARAGTFGGFSADGSSYLDDQARVCTPLTPDKDGATKGKPTCRQAKSEERSGFRKPTGQPTSSAKVKNRTMTVARGAKTIVVWSAPAGLDKVDAVYETADGLTIAVEYHAGTAPASIAFKLAAAPPPDAPPPAAAGGPSAAEQKLMGKGGVWEQRLVACERAGVKLELKTTKKFKLVLEQKCQSSRDKLNLAGSWSAEGDAKVTLMFPQEEGPDEPMPCQLAACQDAPGEDCLACADEDVSFTLMPVVRK